MNFEHSKSWDKLTSTIESGISARDGWNEIIDFHRHIKSKPYWESIKALDLETEQNEIREWLEMLVTEEPLDKDIVSLWIGINKFVFDESEKESYAIYLVGCNEYDADDIDWATEPTYLPEKRYLRLDVLNAVYDTIKTDTDDYQLLDWILPLAYCSLTLTEIIRNKLDSNKFLTHHDKIFVATGHDSGDYVNLISIGN